MMGGRASASVIFINNKGGQRFLFCLAVFFFRIWILVRVAVVDLEIWIN